MKQPQLPSGTVTFLFTDIERSTRLLDELGDEAYADVLSEHHRLLREAWAASEGIEVSTAGDAFFVAFSSPSAALAAAQSAQEALASGPLAVRMGVHTGEILLADTGYVGMEIHRAARIAASGHGGQVLVSAATAALTGAAGLRDLGEHRFKDLSAPERVYQLGDGVFPPLKSLYQTNLPVPATPFIGRERELAEVTTFLARGDVRLLTLTGPGGTGKTRLAAQAAAEVAERFPDGVFLVALAPLRDPEHVLESAAQVVGAKDGLASHIGRKRLLLLFDNFEHVVEAAGGLAELLSQCPQLALLATSREPLRLSAEQEYPVFPFAPEEGIDFFVARARAVRPDFEPSEVVSEICRRLDSLPLALELAAARVKVLNPEQILDRLATRLPLLTGGTRDAPERQRTLEATIAWSYDLLSDEEQRLFRRLSVFAGGCTLEAAEEVAEADLDPLHSLLDKSLIRVTAGRYWMLETIREFAAGRLSESGELEALRHRHAEHFTSMAEASELARAGASELWQKRLSDDYENIRAALTWSCAGGTKEIALRLTASLWRFWWTRGSSSEPTAWYEAALSATDAPEELRVRALYGSANMALLRGDSLAAIDALEVCLSFFRRTEDERGVRMVLNDLGIARQMIGDSAHARPFFEQALALAVQAADARGIAATRANLAGTQIDLGELDEAADLLRTVVDEDREVRDHANAANALEWLGLIEFRRGASREAAALLRESIAEARIVDSQRVLVHACAVGAGVVARRGDHAAAGQIVAGCEAVCADVGLALEHLERVVLDETLTDIRTHLSEAAFEEAWAAGPTSIDDLVEVTLQQLD